MVLIGIIGLLVFASAVFMLVRALAGTDAPIGTVEQIQSYGYQGDAVARACCTSWDACWATRCSSLPGSGF